MGYLVSRAFRWWANRRARVAFVVAVLVVVGVAAFGVLYVTTSGVDDRLAARVPDSVKKDGKLLVATDASYAPAEFTQANGVLTGFDKELFDAVANKLGLRAEYVNTRFDDVLSGVRTGAYEVGVSAVAVNDDRKQRTRMVSYYSMSTQWVTGKGNPANVGVADACGKRLAVEAGTVHVDEVTARSQTCTAGRLPAITIDRYPDQAAVTAALLAGKADAFVADSPVAAYAVKQSGGKLVALPETYDPVLCGYVVNTDQQALADVLRDAVAALIKDGTYRRILAKWGVEAGAITRPAVNPDR